MNYNSCLIEISKSEPSEPPGAEDDLQFRPLGNKHLFNSKGINIFSDKHWVINTIKVEEVGNTKIWFICRFPVM